MEKSLIGKDPGSASILLSSPPIKYFISLEGTFFSAHASICPIRLVKLCGTVDFQHPKRQYPERLRPVSTVYFIKVLNMRDN